MKMAESGVLNLTGNRLTQSELQSRLSACAERHTVHTLILDDGFVRKIENYDFAKENLIQLSLAQNQLTRTFGIQQFSKIRVLNLSSNLLIQLDVIDQLLYLEWLSVGGNQLRNVDIVNKCFKLVHLDVSDNQLTQLPHIHSLTSLRTLLLHQNLLSDLKLTSECLPSHIEILSLADNEIADLNMVEYLSSMHNLEQLSIMKNPCVNQDVSVANIPAINYRPFILNWCNHLNILDGLPVSERQRMKGEWLYSQGNGRAFTVGQHIELITYLSTVCPHPDKAEDEDMKLDKILELKHQLHHNSGQSSPTKTKNALKLEKPLPSPGKRVPDHEKQKRIHAWLGDQSTDIQLPKPTPSLATPGVGKLPTPELPGFVPESRQNTRGDSGEETDPNNLLISESEFISGEELPIESPRKSMRPRAKYSQNGRSEHGSPKKSSVPYSAYDSVGMIQQFYDSPVMTSGENDERWAHPRPPTSTEVPKLVLSTSPPLPQEIDSGQSLAVNPSLSAGGNLGYEEMRYYPMDEDGSLSMSKYEEYEMRPIKPLNSELRLELFGPSNESNQPTKPRPLPLKKNTGSTSRHSVTRPRTGKENTPNPVKSSTKKQNSVSMKKNISSPLKRETLSRVSKVIVSPRRKRQQQLNTKESGSTKTFPKRKKTDVAVSRASVSRDQVDDETPSNRSSTFTRHRSDTGGSIDQESSLLSTYAMRHVAAATKIQALWRGYSARWKNPRVLEIRHEMRSRRSEQYISLLCHEVQTLKEKQESDRKMRELQTEAIRFMWTQIRQLQQNQAGNTASTNHDSSSDSPKFSEAAKTRSPDQGKSAKGQTKSTSPQRSSAAQSKTNPKSKCATLETSKSPKKKSRHAFECDSIVSTICEDDTADESANKKKADVSWRDDPDVGVFPTTATQPETSPENSTEVEAKVEDDCHASMTMELDGTQTDTSTVITRQTEENLVLKSTVEQLQAQVLQLQEALLSFSDRLINNEQRFEKSKQENTVGDQFSTESSNNVSENDETVCLVSEQVSPKPEIYNTEILSARDNMPKMSLLEILMAVNSPLSEKELWSICEQAALSLSARKNKPLRYVSLETTFIRKDGVVSFSEDSADVTTVDSIYLAPELAEPDSKETTKSSIFGLSVTLWSSADYKMSDDQAPSLSGEFETLLVNMSNDDVAKRADIADVIKLCGGYHSTAECNSIEVCGSLYAESSNVRHGSKRKINSQMYQQLVQEQEQKVKIAFRTDVVPSINTWSSVLKPASERQLSPKKMEPSNPHEELMGDIQRGTNLRTSPKPRVFNVKDIFENDPDQLRKLNILPGQRKRNIKAMQMALRRQQPRDPTSPPRAGVATAPRALRAEIRDPTPGNPPTGETSDNCSVVLRWYPSKIFDKHGNENEKEKIMGYRIYVNGQPKGMVGGGKSRALLDGLRKSCEYRIQVRAVSSLSESEPSNSVIVYITKPTVEQEDPPLLPHKTNQMLSNVEKSPQSENSRTHQIPQTNSTKTGSIAKEVTSVASSKPPLTIGAVFPSNLASLDNGKLLNQNTCPPEPALKNGKRIPQNSCVSEPALSTSGDSWTTATSPGRYKDPQQAAKNLSSGEDIVERVLRRYGIQKASTLPPLPRQPAPPSSNESSATVQQETSSNGSGDNITPRSQALLDQLKDQLLQ